MDFTAALEEIKYCIELLGAKPINPAFELIDKMQNETNNAPKILALNKEEVDALLRYFYSDAGYISREFHPRVHTIIDKLRAFEG